MAECGIRIPEDVSVVGFDDLPFAAISSPPLTTLRVPKQEIGRAAVRRLRDMIQDNNGNRQKVQVCTQFIERESVAVAVVRKNCGMPMKRRKQWKVRSERKCSAAGFDEPGRAKAEILPNIQ